MSLLGVKRTCLVALHMSAFDPKRTPTASCLFDCGTAKIGQSCSCGKSCYSFVVVNPQDDLVGKTSTTGRAVRYQSDGIVINLAFLDTAARKAVCEFIALNNESPTVQVRMISHCCLAIFLYEDLRANIRIIRPSAI